MKPQCLYVDSLLGLQPVTSQYEAEALFNNLRCWREDRRKEGTVNAYLYGKDGCDKEQEIIWRKT
jgi:hypothetical protein